MTWRMPSETEPQERVWMAFPPLGASMTATEDDAHEARTAWTAVAHAIVEFEPVTMVVDPADRDVARQYLSADVDVVEAPLDDAWMRDIGPTFVLDEDDRLGAVDWTFNGWGQQEWATWDRDRSIGGAVTRWSGAQPVPSSMVNEGGGIQVDGRGTVLVTETVQLDPLRNPGLDAAGVETELARTIGAEHVVWLPRGLTRDSEKFGTKGHVDIVAALPAPGVALVHSQRDRSHPDHEVSAEILKVLSDSRDRSGAPWRIVEVPAPTVLRDEEGWVDYSYINHLVVNGGVIACGFDDPHDALARDILSSVYPGRRVVTVDARQIFARGGGIHCITQHQPRGRI
ncbi:agmatine/peptidylarginine deiminase [Rhodococcus sp. JVH1]|uniref:agmatine deiminase family protein n=1 Tax=Rhodococcus sp. JVH1 TaxID=745408 RepID=UPI00027226D6|nr:agmatine deiminase family protein [Rhodococcus sp. JVH1]EJI96799.1 porphyromonas-type peptidyl-arginine deiminase family protein [Rhodococcus sp. JVH1]